MNPFSNIFDAELVQFKTRKQVLNLSAGLASVGTGLFTLIVVVNTSTVVPIWVAGISMLMGLITAVFLLDRLQRARRIAWCLKISDEAVVGYDFSRQRHVIRWSEVGCVDVTDSALKIHSRNRSMLEIPYLFNDYERLGHLLLEHTDRHHIRMTVNGKTLTEIDVYNLFPGLDDIARAA
ncbi:MAG: hypothetical protein HKN43_13815 [Rhodothermales bacterium]|nr:hypothetical protein [Rhodothermales bacterium]